MKYIYKAVDETGKIVEVTLEAPDNGAVLDSLAKKRLKPISILSEPKKKSLTIFGKGITVSDKIFLTKYLALMLRVGTDLPQAINILISNFEKPILKSILLSIRTNLEKGQPLHRAFAAYPKYFSPIFINLVKAGEASGNLAQVFDDLSVGLEKEHELRNKISSALIYPIILFGLSLSILFFLITFALPKISAVFEGGNFQPPLFSRIVFAVGGFLGGNILFVIIAFVLLAVLSWVFISKTLLGKKAVRLFANSIPVIKAVNQKIALQRFAATLSSLMKAGIPILDSLDITADAVAHPQIKSAILRVAHEGVARGATLGEAFGRENVFPPVVRNLTSIAEKAGHLEEILKTLSDFYDSEISASVKSLVAFVEPALLVFIGGVIGLIALSILVPIYQLVTQF